MTELLEKQTGTGEEDMRLFLSEIRQFPLLTPGEERYAASWLDMGFADDAIAIAYEKTCLNTGGLNWAYMNKILQRWHSAGLHTVQEIKQGDRKPSVPKGASGELGQAELEALAKILQEG